MAQVFHNIAFPSFFNYGNYSSDNYGSHSLCFSVGKLDVYFSYKTPVAFRYPGYGLIVSENVWSTTTGKHLNWIDGGRKKERVSNDRFNALLSEVTSKMGKGG